MLKGLICLHNRHIVHRDIKSDNVMISSSGDIKLGDFGYAAQLTQEKLARTSRVGTICWMAPEIIKGKGQYNNKVDVWSLGIFALELAHGDPPYLTEDPNKVLLFIVSKPAPKLEGGRWSEEFNDFVNLCLKKDPRVRAGSEDLLQHKFMKMFDKSQQKREYIDFLKDAYVDAQANMLKKKMKVVN